MNFHSVEEYAKTFDIERNNNWVNYSHKFNIINELMNVTSQGLGKLDSKLIIEDNKISSTGICSNPLNDMSEHLTQSYLWVLGSYELIRTLSQYADTEDSIYSNSRESIRSLKRKFEKIRIPLAKFEVARRSETGYGFAWPILISGSVGWQISDVELISRKELSESFLTLMKELP